MGAAALAGTGECPRCRSAVRLPGGGRHRCPRCRCEFYFFPAQAQPLESPGIPVPEGSRCAAHAGNPAVSLCERCGDFLCRLCRTTVEGRVYCPACFDLLCQRGAFKFSHVAFTAPAAAMSFAGLAYLAVLIPGLNLVLSGLAIYNGVSALKQIRRKPDLPGRDQAITALALAGLNLAGTLAAVVFFVVRLGR